MLEPIKIDGKDLQCARCAMCCTAYNLMIPDKDFKLMTDNMRRMGMQLLPYDIITKIEVRVYGLCKHMDTKTALCKDYENRPTVCKEWKCWEEYMTLAEWLRVNTFALTNAQRLSGGNKEQLLAYMMGIQKYFSDMLGKGMIDGKQTLEKYGGIK